MGCNCFINKSSYEAIVDDIFTSINLRNYSIIEINQELEKLKHKDILTETNFQIFFNKFLISDSQNETKEILFLYWMEFFKSKSFKYQLPLIRFIFVCLSKSQSLLNTITNEETDIFSQIIIQYLTLKDTKVIINISEVSLTLEEIFLFIKDYIYSISLLTVDYFKNFHDNPKEFKETLSKIWSIEVIDNFVFKTFFNNKENVNNKILLRKFLKTNLSILKDDILIRKMLTEFSYIHHNEDRNSDLVLNLKSYIS